MPHAVGKEVQPESRRLPKRLPDADGNANRGNGEQTKEEVGNMGIKVFSEKEIREMIGKSKQLEVSALRQLVDTLVEGAVPLAVPVEVFYNIGQQYLEKNAHAFSLQFPPIEELLSKAENTGESSDVEAVEFRGEEEEGAVREVHGNGADNEESLEGLEGLDELDGAADTIEESKEEKAKLLEDKGKEEMLPKSIAERKAKSLLALEAWQREEGLAATFNGLVEELELKSEMNEALLQQSEITQKQNQMLNEQVNRWEKEFRELDAKYKELQDKVNCITKQAEAFLREKRENQTSETIKSSIFVRRKINLHCRAT
ncbi:hypothetical protein Emag_001856 [Eimeria magna]